MQTDKKNLGTKAMLAEIRELGEKFKPADDVPEALGATFPFSARLRPFLALDCTDRYGRRHVADHRLSQWLHIAFPTLFYAQGHGHEAHRQSCC